jgi:hypothetical protein
LSNRDVNKIEDEKMLALILKDSIFSVIDFNKFNNLNKDDKNNILNIIAKKLAEETKNYSSTYYIRQLNDSPWSYYIYEDPHYFQTQGLSYSVDEGATELDDKKCAINFPAELYKNKTALVNIIYNLLEKNQYNSLMKSHVDAGYELQSRP